MSNERRQQGSEIALAAVPAMTDEHRWGETISDERRIALENYLRVWEAEGETHTRPSPLARSSEGAAAVALTGADVYYLAARALAGSGTDRVALASGADRLRQAHESLRLHLTLDLSSLHLEGANLVGAHLEHASLRGVHLEGAHLERAHLEYAGLRGAHLERAFLDEAHLECAALREARLEGAHLGLAHLGRATLHGASLDGAGLYQVQLEHAFLEHANLKQAILIGAHLKGASLYQAHLEHADLREAHLEHADLREAHLEHADLSNANLEHAKLDRAHLVSASLYQAHLEGASLAMAHLEEAFLDEAHLEHASFVHTDLEGARLGRAHLEHAILTAAQLKSASLDGAYLEHASLVLAHLEGANLYHAHLEGVNLAQAHLNGARLTAAFFDKAAHLNDAILTDASVDQISFDNTNLAVVDWSRVTILGDERTARTPKFADSKPKDRDTQIREYRAAVQANRQLAVALQEQGLNEEAARFAYRAQLLQQKVLWRQRNFGAYFFSRFLDALAGYGYKPIRGVIAYVVVVFGFAVAYWLLGPLNGHHFLPDGALVFSVTSFHGRGFFPGGLDLENWVTRLAAVEALIGLLIEISFIATVTQRFFGAK